MTKKQKQVAKDLLNSINKAKTEGMRAETVRTYAIFMNEIREQEKHSRIRYNVRASSIHC